ncbi:MAG: hypothetical protein OXG55_12585 [bacterium]|nr:hypothetical protein [bacterium]MCY4104074.1 hypothetical protein [bacterium]
MTDPTLLSNTTDGVAGDAVGRVAGQIDNLCLPCGHRHHHELHDNGGDIDTAADGKRTLRHAARHRPPNTGHPHRDDTCTAAAAARTPPSTSHSGSRGTGLGVSASIVWSGYTIPGARCRGGCNIA